MPATLLEITSGGVAIERRGLTRLGARVVLALTVAVVVAVAVSSSLFPGSSWPREDTPLVMFCCLVTGLASAATLIRLRFDPTVSARGRSPGSVEVGDGEIIVSVGARERRAYRLEEVTEGWLEPQPACVVLRTRSQDVVSIDVAGADEGRRLLAAAGVASDQQRMKTRLVNAASTHSGFELLALLAAMVLSLGLFPTLYLLYVNVQFALRGVISWGDGGLANAAAWSALLLAGFAVLIRAMVPPLLVVGGDGVAVHRLGSRRFVSYARVAGVRWESRAVLLEVEGGGQVRLPFDPRFALVRDAVRDRILEALARRTGAGASLDTLDRAGRPLAAWRKHLSELVREQTGYRSSTLPRDAVVAVLEDVSAPRERRIAAALVLARVDDAPVKARLRAAVDSCADEPLRRALEAAAEDELAEGELEAALRQTRER